MVKFLLGFLVDIKKDIDNEVTPKFWCVFRLTNMELSRILRVNKDYKLLVG